MGTYLADGIGIDIKWGSVQRRQALLQLRLIRTVLHAERRRGTATPELLARSAELAELTVIQIEGEPDKELLELLSSIRSETSRRS